MVATCPYCDAPIATLSLSRLEGVLSPSEKLPCLIYACPTCNKALSTALDSTEIRASIIQEIRSKECCT